MTDGRVVRTGQAHRTLLGHTGPVTCLQFDEIHIVSGSLDKSIRVSVDVPFHLGGVYLNWSWLPKIWDVRSGGVFETLNYDHGVTALQFDTRKVVAATGENGVKVCCTDHFYAPHYLSAVSVFLLQIYNRTTMQHSTLLTNGHTRPVDRLRYMDRYLASGGRDSTVKIWTL